MDNQSILIILAAVLAVSEALALSPKLKSNSVIQMVMSLVKIVKKGLGEKKKD